MKTAISDITAAMEVAAVFGKTTEETISDVIDIAVAMETFLQQYESPRIALFGAMLCLTVLHKRQCVLGTDIREVMTALLDICLHLTDEIAL